MIPPLPSDLVAAIEDERSQASLDPAVERRLDARIASTLAAGIAPVAIAEAISQAPTAGATFVKAAFLKGAALFVAGAVSGSVGVAVVQGAWTEREAPSVSAASPAPVAGPVAAPELPPAPAAPAPVPAPEVVKPLERQDERDRLLAEERLGLEIARTAIARGRYDEALAALARQERLRGRSRLGEERRGLRVQALIGAGRPAEARAELEALRAEFPESLLAPVLEEALEAR